MPKDDWTVKVEVTPSKVDRAQQPCRLQLTIDASARLLHGLLDYEVLDVLLTDLEPLIHAALLNYSILNDLPTLVQRDDEDAEDDNE